MTWMAIYVNLELKLFVIWMGKPRDCLVWFLVLAVLLLNMIVAKYCMKPLKETILNIFNKKSTFCSFNPLDASTV